MLAKVCDAPKTGGSARGCVRYILGYELGDKGNALNSHEALLQQSMGRPDFGVGSVWAPADGHSVRPSAIYASGVTALATADLEIQATCSGNPRVKTPVMHLVFTLQTGEDPGDHALIGGVQDTLKKLSLDHHQYVIAVHRDTDNVHAHLAISAVDPRTYRAYNRFQFHSRLDRACREVEIERGWRHDIGLAKVMESVDGTKRVEWTTRAERHAMRRQRYERSRHDRVRHRFSDVALREGSFHRYADAMVAARLRDYARLQQERHERVQWIDLHNIASRYNCNIVEENGLLYLQDRETAKRTAFDLVSLSKVQQCAGEFLTPEQAEDAFARDIAHDPHIVLRAITAEESTLSREDIDRYLCERLSDIGDIEELSQHVLNSDELVMLSPDVAPGLFTTKEIRRIERELAEDAATLADTNDARFSRADLYAAIRALEKERGFEVSDEQRALLERMDRDLVVAQGDPGTGKTTVMQAVRIYADIANRKVVGLTLSQAAAERLEEEAGFRSVNTARARVLEQSGEELIPFRGIVVVDEAGMVDSRSMREILRLARERECKVIQIGDTKQLQPIDAGAAFRITSEEAREHGQYTELHENHRQENEWHRTAVQAMGSAIQERDAVKMEHAIEALREHGAIHACRDRDAVIRDAVAWYEQRAVRGSAILIAGDRETVRHANEEIRRQRGLEGHGRQYFTDGGWRQLAVSDRFIFGENNKQLGVFNGYTGAVISTERYSITVRLDNGREVTFDPRRYQHWDHGYATTIHKAQGASVDACAAVINRGASAQLTFVALSRSKNEIAVFHEAASFKESRDLADHLSESIRTKTTTRTLEERLRDYGGKQTTFSKNVEAERESDAHPLRKTYNAEMAARTARRDAEMKAVRERYVFEREELQSSGKAPGDIRDEARDLFRQYRRDQRAVIEAYNTEDFGQWAHRQKQTDDRLFDLHKHRELEERRNRQQHIQRVERTQQQERNLER